MRIGVVNEPTKTLASNLDHVYRQSQSSPAPQLQRLSGVVLYCRRELCSLYQSPPWNPTLALLPRNPWSWNDPLFGNHSVIFKTVRSLSLARPILLESGACFAKEFLGQGRPVFHREDHSGIYFVPELIRCFLANAVLMHICFSAL